MRMFGKRALTIVAAAAIGVGAAGIAWAWSNSGTGDASAQAAGRNAVTATAATVSDDLAPGNPGSIALTIGNTNKYQVTVTVIEKDPAKDIVSTVAGCEAYVTLAAQSGPWAVAANNTRDLEIPGAVTFRDDTPDECAGAGFTIPVKLTAHSG